MDKNTNLITSSKNSSGVQMRTGPLGNRCVLNTTEKFDVME